MTHTIEQVIHEAAQGSSDGRLHFGQVVGMLMAAGVESYHVDYRAGRSTYYLPSGESFTVNTGLPEVTIAQNFNIDAVQAAIRGAQRGEIMYPQFKNLSQKAGCVCYTVWVDGRHVTYYGRHGENHVERFPD